MPASQQLTKIEQDVIKRRDREPRHLTVQLFDVLKAANVSYSLAAYQIGMRESQLYKAVRNGRDVTYSQGKMIESFICMLWTLIQQGRLPLERQLTASVNGRETMAQMFEPLMHLTQHPYVGELVFGTEADYLSRVSVASETTDSTEPSLRADAARPAQSPDLSVPDQTPDAGDLPAEVIVGA